MLVNYLLFDYFDKKNKVLNERYNQNEYLLIKKLKIFRIKKKELTGKSIYLEEVLANGVKRAQKLAKQKRLEVHRKMGLN